MKRFFRKIYLLLALFIGISTLNSCKKDEPTEIENINHFISDCFNFFYLWNNQLPSHNAAKETDPYAFFDKMKYKEDKWSTLTNDVRAMEESFSGKEMTFGYSLSFYSTESESIFAVVRYVHPDSPAEAVGLKRGDIILKVNGNNITESNYLTLYHSSSLSLSMAKYENENLELTGETISLNAVKTYMNPIIAYKIIDIGTHKIGYLHYSDYLLKSHDDLEAVFKEFKDTNVSDIVLDLRYNSGGYAVTSQFLCSMLLSRGYLNGKNIYLQELWNDDYMNYFKNNKIDVNKYFSNPIIDKDDNGNEIPIPVRINLVGLQRVYILTGKETASTSEATIVGLMPYMDVYQIGDTTHGEFCGGLIISPEIAYYTSGSRPKWIDGIKNWGTYMMLHRYKNAHDYPNQAVGLAPDFLVEEDIVRYPYALGDENEPLLAKALELITGISKKDAALKTTPIQNYRPANKLKVPQKATHGKMIGNQPNLHFSTED